MILTYCYRLLPSKAQHRALEAIVEDQRQLYNAALEERVGAYRNAGLTRTYVDQCRALTEWRRSDPDCSGCGIKVPKALGQRMHECSHCGLAIDRDLNAARNILHRAGVGPGLHNVADCGMRAGGNLVGEGIQKCSRVCETLN